MELADGGITPPRPSARRCLPTAPLRASILESSGALPNLSFEVQGIYPVDPAGVSNGNSVGDQPKRSALRSSNERHRMVVASRRARSGALTNIRLIAWPTVSSSRRSSISLRNASEYIDEWLKATNSELVRVGFQLVALPYGDTTAVGNGATFTPQTQPIYNLDDDDFIRDDNADPILVKRPSIQDAYNVVKLEYVDRGNDYNPNVVAAEDLRAEELYLYRPESPRQYHFITLNAIAATVAQTLLARMVFIRNTYTFKLPASYILLNPMDLVTLTDVGLGLNQTPVRIRSINENQKHELEVEAEEFPWGCSGPTEYPKQFATSSIVQANADPGVTNPPIVFEAVPRLRSGDSQQELWMALSGNSIPISFLGGGGSGATGHAIIVNGAVAKIVIDNGGTGYTSAPAVSFGGYQGGGAAATSSLTGTSVTSTTITSGGSGYASAWGGCRVWISTDGTQYTAVGTQQGSSTMGATTADWPAYSDPDEVDNLSVDLTESNGVLPNFTTTQENNFASLFYVGGGTGNVPYELGAYASATLTSANKYTITAGSSNPIRRNVFGAPNGPIGGVDHPSGSAFCALNQNIFKLSIDQTLAAQVIYLKFTSFNFRGNMEQSLADVEAYTFTPSGLLMGLSNFGYSISPATNTAPSNWAANTYYPVGSVVYDGTNVQFNVGGTRPAGTTPESGGSTPSWSAIGKLTTDNTCAWINCGLPGGSILAQGTGADASHLYVLPFYVNSNLGVVLYFGSQGVGVGISAYYSQTIYAAQYDPTFKGYNRAGLAPPSLSSNPLVTAALTPGWFNLGSIALSSGGGSLGTGAGQAFPNVPFQN